MMLEINKKSDIFNRLKPKYKENRKERVSVAIQHTWRWWKMPGEAAQGEAVATDRVTRVIVIVKRPGTYCTFASLMFLL